MHNDPRFTRRSFLETVGTGMVAATVCPDAASPNEPDASLMIIDCHAHIYGEDEKKYPTIPKPCRPPKGKGTVAHLEREMKAAGIRDVTAVQTSTFYRWDNRFTTDSARSNKDFMVGIWGSDFPCELWCPKVTYARHLRIFTHDTYARHLRIFTHELGLDEATKNAVLGETAHRLWFQGRA